MSRFYKNKKEPLKTIEIIYNNNFDCQNEPVYDIRAVSNWAFPYNGSICKQEWLDAFWTDITPRVGQIYTDHRWGVDYTISKLNKSHLLKVGVSWVLNGKKLTSYISYNNLFNNFNLKMNADIISILVDEHKLNSNVVEPLIRELEDLGKEFHEICERQCNGIATRNDDWRRDKLQGDAELAVQKLANHSFKKFGPRYSYEYRLYLNSDPRGNPFGIILPGGRSNNMGGEDWRLDIP